MKNIQVQDQNIHGQWLKFTYSKSKRDLILKCDQIRNNPAFDANPDVQDILKMKNEIKGDLVKEFIIEKKQKPFLQNVIVYLICSSILVYFYLINLYNSVIFTLLESLTSLLFFHILKTTVVKEVFMTIEALGIHIKCIGTLGNTVHVRFIPKNKVKAIVINETIKMQRVIPYLALILHSPDSYGRLIVPIFKNTLPRLGILTKIYQELQ